MGQHADYFGAADSSIPLALRQLAPEEGSDPVELVRRQRLKKAADIGESSNVFSMMRRQRK